jgi:DNA-directed RNA polymerase subunit beta
MQSLCLDVEILSDEGEQIELRDEDDDVLRSAEDLGMDLSGLGDLDDDLVAAAGVEIGSLSDLENLSTGTATADDGPTLDIDLSAGLPADEE